MQGQLNIANKSKCFFVVYVNDAVDIFVEEIERDTELWEKSMLPKLEKFYKECVAPEIVRNNIGRGLKCIDPPYIKNSIQEFEAKKKPK